MVLIKLQALFRFHLFSLRTFHKDIWWLVQGHTARKHPIPSQMLIPDLVVRSPYSPLMCDSFPIFPHFPWPWQLWRSNVLQIVPPFGFVWCFLMMRPGLKVWGKNSAEGNYFSPFTAAKVTQYNTTSLKTLTLTTCLRWRLLMFSTTELLFFPFRTSF